MPHRPDIAGHDVARTMWRDVWPYAVERTGSTGDRSVLRPPDVLGSVLQLHRMCPRVAHHHYVRSYALCVGWEWDFFVVKNGHWNMGKRD